MTKIRKYRMRVSFDDLENGDLVVAYKDDGALKANKPKLEGAFRLVHKDPDVGKVASWMVHHVKFPHDSEWTNFSDCTHVFRIDGPKVGFKGPWADDEGK